MHLFDQYNEQNYNVAIDLKTATHPIPIYTINVSYALFRSFL